MKRTRGQPRPQLATALVTAFTAALVLGGCEAPHRDVVAEICNNHMDDDGNGQVDCQDTTCMGKPVCTAEICNNNIDDNGDGKFDCADPTCAGKAPCGAVVDKCDNGMIDPGEDCDGTELGGRTCITQGFQSGTLACKVCTIDTTGCSHNAPENCHNAFDDDHDGAIDCADSDCLTAAICLCGNGVLDDNEPCDGTLIPRGESCVSRGYAGGSLTCTSDCQSLDASNCTPPVCGDGVVSNGEQCDDGNATANDGCDPTCHIELGPLCATAKPLLVGTSEHQYGDGTNGIDGSCTGGGGKEDIYTYTPATTGMVTIVLSTALELSLYLRTACVDSATELACVGPAGNGSSPAASVAVSAGVPITVFVDSASFTPFPGGDAGPASSATGPYTLIVVQTP